MRTKIVLLTLSTILFSSSYAKENEYPERQTTANVQMAYPYFSLGLGPAPIPFPIFGAGYRAQYGHHGFDASINASTIYWATAVKASALYHCYFKPNPCSQFYAGVGPALGALFSTDSHHTRYHGLAGAAEFVFGKQYKNDTGDIRFFQADIDFPIVIGRKPYVVAAPLVVFKYGIGF